VAKSLSGLLGIIQMNLADLPKQPVFWLDVCAPSPVEMNSIASVRSITLVL
jgi:hypothetical protein